MKIRALFALAPPMKFDSQKSIDQYYSFVDEYAKPKEIRIRGSEHHDGKPLFIKAYKCSTASKRRYFSDLSIFGGGDIILEFYTDVTFPKEFSLTYADGTKAPYTRAKLKAIWANWLPVDLNLIVQTYLVAICLACDGSVRPIENVWIVGKSQSTRSDVRRSLVHEATEYLREENAFPDITLSVHQVAEWIFAQNGIFDGYSDAPSSRALNYFTRLFVREFRDDELSDMVWALAGIEAILVEGGRSSGGQLREKLNALLASKVDPKWLSTMVDRSYEFRSKMIHGNRQIWSWFRNGEDDTAKRFDEEYSSLRFVVGALIIVLKYVIANNVNRIAFKTVIDHHN